MTLKTEFQFQHFLVSQLFHCLIVSFIYSFRVNAQLDLLPTQYNKVYEGHLPKNDLHYEDAFQYHNNTYGDRMMSSAAASLILHPKDCNGLCVSAKVCRRHGGTAKGMCSKDGGVFCCFARSCNQVSKEVVSFFHNPGYPLPAIGTMICQHDIVVKTGICGIRLEFQDFNTTRPLDRGICDIDQFLILNSLDGAAFPRCGELSGYTTIVSVDSKQKVPLTLLSIIQSTKESCKWSIKVTQMKCEKRRSLDYPDCGLKYATQDDVRGESNNFYKRMSHFDHSIPHHDEFDRGQKLDISVPYIDNFYYLEYLKQSHAMMMASDGPMVNPNKTICRNSAKDMMTNKQMHNHGLKNLTKTNQMSFQSRIIRGDDTDLFEVPWQVSIQNKKGHFCGGAILSEYFVLTASHCFMSIAPLALKKVKVVLGDLKLDTHKETDHVEAEVHSVIFHSHFDPYYLRNDIAVIRLRHPIHFRPGIQPVCLGESGNSYVKQTATISGWGATTYPRGKLATTLQHVQNQIIDNTECQKLLKIHYLFPTMICAVAPKCAGTCFGDSGGPLTVEKNKVTRLVGIVSFGIGGCAILPYWPDVYTRVSEYIGCKCTTGIPMYIQNVEGHDILLTMPSRAGKCGWDDDLYGTTQFMNNSGITLIEVIGSPRASSISVTSGVVMLGTVDGMDLGNLTLKLNYVSEGKTTMRQFEILSPTKRNHDDLDENHRIVYREDEDSETEIGRILETEKHFILQFSQKNLDCQIKAMALVATYNMYLKHHVRTRLGACGLRNVLLICGGLVTVFALMLIITYILSYML